MSDKRNEELATKDASDELNSRFTNMRKAFHWVDVDNSGTINRKELERALKLWNLPMAQGRIDQLWDAMDVDGSGEVDYHEFVNALARDTVMPGHTVEHKHDKEQGTAGAASRVHLTSKHLEAADAEAAAQVIANRQKAAALDEAKYDARDIARVGVNQRFSEMRKAFKYVDLDNSGTVDKNELRRALEMWNMPMTDEKLDELWAQCDTTGDGEISYDEFVAAFARDTAGEMVAPVRAGKQTKTFEERMRDETRDDVEEAINTHFKDMRKAFHWIDVDNSGTINRAELEMALERFNIPFSESKIDLLWDAVDTDGSGEVDYDEFIRALARDTFIGDTRR